MAFTTTINNNGVPNIVGTKKIVTGTFTNTGGSTGGDIDTGLKLVEFFDAKPTGASVTANEITLNETFPASTNEITIVTGANVDGVWIAYGE